MKSILERYRDIQEEKAESDLTWDMSLHSWVVMGAALSEAVLRSPHVLVYEHQRELQDFAVPRGIVIDALLRALPLVPLATNGEAHRTTRRALAANIQLRVEEAVACFKTIAEKHVDAMCENTGDVDLFDGLLLPVMNAAICALGGNQISGDEFKLASPAQIFGIGQKWSGPRLRNMEQQLARSQASSDGSSDAIAMTLFAGDPTLGSLGQTLIEQLRANHGIRLSDIRWAPKPTRTSLPFVERHAAEDFELGGTLIRQGDRISIYLGAFEHEGSLHYGAGPHRCLGKSLAERLWATLTSSLSRRSERIEILDVAYREADFAFTMPVKIMSRISK